MMKMANDIRLGDVAEFIRGITFKPEDKVSLDSDDAVICMRTKNVQAELDETDLIAIPSAFVKRKEQYLKNGDILVSTANSWDLVGKCSWVGNLLYKSTAGGFISILRGKQDKVLSRYLYHWMASPRIQCYLRHCGRQTTNISNMSYDRAESLIIPIPYANNVKKSLLEQQRIAKILDKADTIRKKRHQALQLANEFLKSTFLEMFGDPVTNTKGWKTKPLGQLCHICRGSSPRPIDKYLGGSVPWIKIGDATQNDGIYMHSTKQHILETGVKKSRYLKAGSLIFANCGVSLGFARIIKFDGCIHDGWLSFSELSESIQPIFLLKLLNSITEFFRKTAPDGTQPNLNTQIMKEFSIILPPIQMQLDFIDIVEKHSRISEGLNKAANEADKLFNSLVQRAFKGELI